MKKKQNTEEILNNFMKNLQCSYKEAVALLEYDNSLQDADVLARHASTSSTTDESYRATCLGNKKFKNYVRSATTAAKISKPRAPQKDKSQITDIVAATLTADETIEDVVVIPEKTIDFVKAGTAYNFKLTKHKAYVGIKESKAEKRKVDEAKAAILSTVATALNNSIEGINTLKIQTETKINFNIADTNYTLAFTAHRK